MQAPNTETYESRSDLLKHLKILDDKKFNIFNKQVKNKDQSTLKEWLAKKTLSPRLSHN